MNNVPNKESIIPVSWQLEAFWLTYVWDTSSTLILYSISHILPSFMHVWGLSFFGMSIDYRDALYNFSSLLLYWTISETIHSTRNSTKAAAVNELFCWGSADRHSHRLHWLWKGVISTWLCEWWSELHHELCSRTFFSD